MSSSRIPALALVADLAAVIVFAAIGRASHAESDGLPGLLGTVAPFAVGLLVAWATPWLRVRPAGLRAGGVVLVGTVVIGLALRAVFLGRLPLSFAIVAVISLAVLLLGWRGVAMFVSRQVAQRVR